MDSSCKKSNITDGVQSWYTIRIRGLADMKRPNDSTSGIVRTLTEHRRLVVIGLLLAAAVYVVIPQLGFLDNSWSVLLESDWRLGLLAGLALLVSYAAATGIYALLASVKLRLRDTYIVQMASSFASRALPAGVGSLGVNYLYLRRRGQTKVGAASVVAVNNTMGFIGHACWLVAAILWLPVELAQVHIPGGIIPVVFAVGVLLLIGVLFLWHRTTVVIRSFIKQLEQYRRMPWRLAGALGFSIILTGSYIVMLWLSGRATGLGDFEITSAIVALTVGVIAQTATPTPGGIGGAEAGLVAGLSLVGLPVAQAVTVTVLYRVITYWLPLAIGSIAFWWSLRQGYIR